MSDYFSANSVQSIESMPLFDQPEKKRQGKRTQRNSAKSKRAILNRLEEGPLPKWEAEALEYEGFRVHRGQAVIGSLREQGHKIVTTWHDGIECYEHKGFRERVKVTKTMQSAYYASSHWISMAAKRKDHDAWRCVQCGSREELQTHHWRYNLFNENMIFDLITLCRECHVRVHSDCGGSSIHFPRHIDTETAELLGWSPCN